MDIRATKQKRRISRLLSEESAIVKTSTAFLTPHTVHPVPRRLR